MISPPAARRAPIFLSVSPGRLDDPGRPRARRTRRRSPGSGPVVHGRPCAGGPDGGAPGRAGSPAPRHDSANRSRMATSPGSAFALLRRRGRDRATAAAHPGTRVGRCSAVVRASLPGSPWCRAPRRPPALRPAGHPGRPGRAGDARVLVLVRDGVRPAGRRLEREPSVRREQHLDPAVELVRRDVLRAGIRVLLTRGVTLATRDGNPSVRSITAMALANCWQKPRFVFVRNSSSV